MTLNERLTAMEASLRRIADADGRIDAIRKFRAMNPDCADRLIDRLANRMGMDPASAFEQISGLNYDHSLPWDANFDRCSPPPGVVPSGNLNPQPAGTPARKTNDRNN